MRFRVPSVRAAVATVALSALAAAPAAAQPSLPVPSSTSAACVAEPIGCQQMDFFFTLLAGAPQSVRTFQLAITSPTARFLGPVDAPYLEADDGGFLATAATLSADRRTFDIVFDPFDAVLNPTLRLRTEMEQPLGGFTYDYVGRNGNDQIVLTGSGTFTPNQSVVPEPASVAMLAAGLGGLGVGLARRRRRTVVTV